MNSITRTALYLLALMLVVSSSLPIEGASETAEEASTIYRSTDASGNPIFSDQSTTDAQPQSLKEPMTYDGKGVNDSLARVNRIRQGNQSEGESNQAVIPPYIKLAIVSPADEEVIRENSGLVSIRGSVAPAIHQGHVLEIVMDGKVVGEGNSVTLQGVFRGTHQVKFRVTVADSGEVFQEGPPISFTLLRYSRLHPGTK